MQLYKYAENKWFINNQEDSTYIYFGAGLLLLKQKCYKYIILGLELHCGELNTHSSSFLYRLTKLIIVQIVFVLVSDFCQSSG